MKKEVVIKDEQNDFDAKYPEKCRQLEESLSPEQKTLFYQIEKLMEDSFVEKLKEACKFKFSRVYTLYKQFEEKHKDDDMDLNSWAISLACFIYEKGHEEGYDYGIHKSLEVAKDNAFKAIKNRDALLKRLNEIDNQGDIEGSISEKEIIS